MGQQRLQKYLAACGVASRRAAEELIRNGRVTINGAKVQAMGVQVDPALDQICVDGRPVTRVERHVYIALNKPIGVISAVSDNRGRQTVTDLLQGVTERVYPVGRLDYDSSGLVLLTNDGELAAHLMHPRHHVRKLYRVVVEGRPNTETLRKLALGVMLEDGPTLPAKVRISGSKHNQTELEIELREGRNRQIRRMCRAVGHDVVSLRRIQIGSLRLGSLQSGQWRLLDPDEVESLRQEAGMSSFA